MIGRERELSTVVNLLSSGMSVDVVGERGSGQTTFLAALEERLQAFDWTVLTVRSVASLRGHPLAALHITGIGEASPRGLASSVQETSAALAEATRREKSVLLVDDWDDLDESSWGVIDSLRRSRPLATVLTRLKGLHARHTPSGMAASSIQASYVIELDPLGFDEIKRVIIDRLGGDVEANTMSTIFARSGGNVGIACALVDACRHDGTLVKHEVEGWVATGALWSPGLASYLEAHLESLTEPMRDALELLALIGMADLTTVMSLIEEGIVESLEERSLIMIVPTGSENLVTVIPPLLAEYFRHRTIVSRRIRLTSQIEQQLSESISQPSLLARATSVRPIHTLNEDATFVRLTHEQRRTRLAVTKSEWERDRGPHSAARYIRALWQISAESHEFESIFSQTHLSDAPADALADFVSTWGSWLAYVQRDPDAMIAYFQEMRPRVERYSRLLDAVEVRALTNLRGIPENYATLLEITDDVPPHIVPLLIQTQIVVLNSLGRFTDAHRLYGTLSALDGADNASMTQAYYALTMMGRGDLTHALEYLEVRYAEVHSTLDAEGTMIFGSTLASCLLLSGHYRDIDRILDTLVAIGNPTPFLPTLYLMVVNTAALVALRRGSTVLGERYVRQMQTQNWPDGAFPNQSVSWSLAQVMSLNGDLTGAANTLWESSEKLWLRGARFASALGFLSALELAPTQERLTIVEDRCAAIDGELIPAYLCFVRALVHQDANGMLDAFARARDVGLVGIALSALRNASSLFRATGESQNAAEAERRETEFRRQNNITWADVSRFNASNAVLTEREVEVARLAVKGLSNQEIATSLVLSVRTVETHMHRIMRKLSVASRQDITLSDAEKINP